MNKDRQYKFTKRLLERVGTWPTFGTEEKERILYINKVPISYVDFFDGVYDLVYSDKSFDNVVDCVNALRKNGIELDTINEESQQGEQIKKQTGYTIGYLKGVYYVMSLEKTELICKKTATKGTPETKER